MCIFKQACSVPDTFRECFPGKFMKLSTFIKQTHEWRFLQLPVTETPSDQNMFLQKKHLEYFFIQFFSFMPSLLK